MADTFVVTIASGTYAGTFTYSFAVAAPDMPRSRQADVTVEHIPGSGPSLDYIDIGGAYQSRQLTLTLIFDTAAHYDRCESGDSTPTPPAVGQQGLLTFINGSMQAILKKLSRTRQSLGPVTSTTGGMTWATAEFILVD